MSEARPLTRFEEWRYSKKIRHEWAQRRGGSCNRVFRGFCWRCLLLDVTGINRRRRRAYLALMRGRARSIAPLVMVRNAEGRWVPKVHPATPTPNPSTTEGEL